MVNKRNSSIEIMRIIAMFGILMMHGTGGFFSTVTQGINSFWLIIINDIGQIGVTYFALVTGYYGIRNSWIKTIEIHKTIFFYSILSLLITTYLNHSYPNVYDVLYSIFPVLSRKYWYATCYFFLLVLSPYLNIIMEEMQEKYYYQLVGILIIILSVLPTAFFVFPDVMQDGGKGLAWIILCYLIGGALRKRDYALSISDSTLWILLGASQIIMLVLNGVFNLFSSVFRVPFAKDCSIFILLSSCAILIFAVKHPIYSTVINRVARNIFAVYLIEGALRQIISHLVGITVKNDKNMLIFDIALSAITILGGIFIGEIAKICFGGIKSKLSSNERLLIKRAFLLISEKSGFQFYKKEDVRRNYKC